MLDGTHPWRAGRATIVLLAGGVVGAGLVSLLPGVPGLLVRLQLILLGILATCAGVVRHRPGRRRPWNLVIAGLLLSAAGDVTVLVALSRGPVTANVPADAWLTAAAGVLLLAGMWDATRLARGRDLGGALDAVIVALAGATLVWQLLVVPAAAPGWAGSGTEMAGALQILLLLAVLGLLVRTAAVLPASQRVAARLLAVALATGIAAFLLGALSDATGGAAVYGGLRGGLGVLANVAVGAAALHPSMRALTEPLTAAPDALTTRRTVGLGIALCVPPGVLCIGVLAGRDVGLLTLAGAWVALVPTTLARLHLLARTRDEARRELVSTERRLLSLIAQTGDTVLLVDASDPSRAPVRFASPSALTLLGRDPAALVGVDLLDIAEPEGRALLAQLLTGSDPSPRHGDVRIRALDGAVRWVEVIATVAADGTDVHDLVVTLRDVTARKRTELRWAEAALHDQLTGLFNRRGIEGWLEAELAAAGSAPATALLVCDLDGFKPVNDRHGHAAGDAVLQEVAARLQRSIRDGDVVGRIGGDEFVVVCSRIEDLDVVARVADRLLEVIARPLPVDGVEHRIGVSIGVTVSTPGVSGATLLEEADVALYAAKAAGKGRVSWAPAAARVGSVTG